MPLPYMPAQIHTLNSCAKIRPGFMSYTRDVNPSSAASLAALERLMVSVATAVAALVRDQEQMDGIGWLRSLLMRPPQPGPGDEAGWQGQCTHICMGP